MGDRGSTWRVLLQQNLNERFPLAGRGSGDQVDGGPRCFRGTVAATFKITPQLCLRAEYSRDDFRGIATDPASFGVIQAFVRF